MEIKCQTAFLVIFFIAYLLSSVECFCVLTAWNQNKTDFSTINRFQLIYLFCDIDILSLEPLFLIFSAQCKKHIFISLLNSLEIESTFWIKHCIYFTGNIITDTKHF